MRRFTTTFEHEAHTDRWLAEPIDRTEGRRASVRARALSPLKWGGTGLAASRNSSAVWAFEWEIPSGGRERGEDVASGIVEWSVLGPSNGSAREGGSSSPSNVDERSSVDDVDSSGEAGGSAGRLSSRTQDDGPPTLFGASERNTDRELETGGNMRSSSSTESGLVPGSGSDGSRSRFGGVTGGTDGPFASVTLGECSAPGEGRESVPDPVEDRAPW